MEPSIGRNCSFVVKIWVEDEDLLSGQIHWRGHITHALSGSRRYFENFPTALSFALPYLEAIGIKFEKNELPGIAP